VSARWHDHVRAGTSGGSAPDANRGDRGYGGSTLSRAATPASIRQELAHPGAPRDERSINVSRPTPAPVQHSQPVSRPVSNGAFTGIQSSQETRNNSNRGQQSMQSIPRSAPVSRPAPSGGGGGGGGHVSGGGSGSGGHGGDVRH